VEPGSDFVRRLVSARRLLVMGHCHPDGDALGSAVGLGEALRGMGRDVTVGLAGRVAPNTRFILEGFTGFRGAIDNPEDVRSGGWDLLVLVDCHGPERVWPEHRDSGYGSLPPYMVIDHHVHLCPLDRPVGVFHDPRASSTGEMVVRLLKALGAPFTPPLLEALLAAIASDTGFFTQANTTAACLEDAAFLVGLGGDLESVNSRLNQSFSPARMRLLSLSLACMEFHMEGRVALMPLTSGMLGRAGAALEDAEGFVDFPRAVRGVELAAFFKEDGRGGVKVSLRSRYPVSARELAYSYGGGGHVQAAAYSDPSPTCREAMDRFLAGIGPALPVDRG
jgi:phosphoesterase RecJ-like protein